VHAVVFLFIKFSNAALHPLPVTDGKRLPHFFNPKLQPMNQERRTELKDLGEFGLISRLAANVQLVNPESVKGIGDDAAVLDTGGEQYSLVSTDMLVEGIHFDLTYVPLQYLGFKAVSVNVSDIAAMNGVPKQITVSIALSNRFSVEAIEALYDGIHAACRQYKVDLVGGDTTSSRSGLVISVTAVGLVPKSKVVYRSTARANDILCATGDLGGAYMGLQVLEREKQVFLSNPEMQPQLEDKDYIVQRQLKPLARMDVIYDLADAGVIPTAMIDVSDGLASEILHICRNSNVGAVLYEDKLPISGVTYNTAAEFNISPTTCALNGGEDYELLFTIKPQDYDKIRNHPDISFIGYITDTPEDVHMISKSGSKIAVRAQGWVHF
jgi:thiamine-monophosphate kinase